MHRRDLQIVACDVLNGFHLAAMWCTPDSAFGHLAAGAGRAGRAARTDAPVPAAARMASREGGAGGLLVLLVLLVLLLPFSRSPVSSASLFSMVQE